MNGQPKQLLEFRGETLLRRAVKTAVRSNAGKIVVVLGAKSEVFQDEIENLPVHLTVNEHAESGMSSSIKAGLSVFSGENLDAVIIMLCDQPLITTKTLQKLVGIFVETGKPIVVCEYENTIGVPALFAREMFDELMDLTKDEGAKKIINKYINKYKDKTQLLNCPEAGLDIDTFDDYQKLRQYSR